MKNIILLSDGTGNSAAKRNKTNVWRLYSALDLHRKDQVAMYDDGVGSQQFLLFRLLGGAFGWGLKRNVIELYKFLCRNYEADDTNERKQTIYLFGFSRGAFTVRMLAGLIAECGLFTHYDSERDLDNVAHRNFSFYRRRYKRWYSTLCPRKKKKKNVMPKIEFIGVWDTVDAYGLPIDELTAVVDKFIFPMRFPDQKLSETVLRACHAVSVDDERRTFDPILWDESEKENRDRIEQVWFPGVHSDVGGGYPQDELSLLSLDWMISKVEASDGDSGSGLHFLPDVREQYWRRSDWNGTQHDSRSGLAAYYRYAPRNIEALCNDTNTGKTGDKIVPKIHRSVFERIKGKVVPYAPTGLPKKYEIVSTRDSVVDFETESEAEARVDAMNGALDIIYWRRWLYFAFLATTLVFVFSRYLLDWLPCAPCGGSACILDPVLLFVRDILPQPLAGWIEAWRQNQMWLLTLLVLYVVFSYLKCKASAATSARATAAWSRLNRSKGPQERSSSSTTEKLRKSKLWRQSRRSFWLIVAVLILITLAVALNRIAFYVRDTAGFLRQASDITVPAADQADVMFDAGEPCLPTALALAAGYAYRFDVQSELPWSDGQLSASPDGIEGTMTFAMRTFSPFRRHPSRLWFELTGRVGNSGREVFAIASGGCYTARSDEKLYLYVNDAVFGILSDPYWALPYFW